MALGLRGVAPATGTVRFARNSSGSPQLYIRCRSAAVNGQSLKTKGRHEKFLIVGQFEVLHADSRPSALANRHSPIWKILVHLASAITDIGEQTLKSVIYGA